MISSLRNKIFAWFISFSLVLLISIITLNSHYYKKREEKNQLIALFTNLENRLISIFKNTNAFFSTEITNPLFFQTGRSVYLRTNDSLISIVHSELKALKEFSSEQNINISSESDSLLSHIAEFNLIFKQIVRLMYERGYKDYGTEGEMRLQIHKLEELRNINQVDVLMLRRHEKDYIIRHEDQYVNNLYKLAEQLKIAVAQSPEIDRKQKDSVIQIIDSYKLLFNKIVSLDRQIGLRDNTALKRELDELSLVLENLINNLIDKVSREKLIILKQARVTYITEMILAIILSGLVSLFITKKVTHSLIRLTQYISTLTKEDFSYAPISFPKNTEAEILMIYNEFNNLIDHLERRENQRDKALNELKIQEMRYRQMADMLPVSLFETDTSKKLTYINQRFMESFCYKGEEWKTLYLNNVIKQENLIGASSDNTSINSFETTGIDCNGKEFPVQIYSSERIEDNIHLGYRGIIVDISDKVKSIEELNNARVKAEESDRLKTAFLANMSHEIRTPMNAVIGFSELLNSDFSAEDEKKEFILQIQNSGKRLIKIIDDIIDIAKIEAGEIRVAIEEFDVNKMMDEIYQHYLNMFKINGQKTTLKLNKGTEGQLLITSDPDRIRQIFMNLLNNAMKFTHQGTVETGYTTDQEFIKFYVKDTGIGIPADKIKIVFERFRQADESMSRKYGGTGLGLSIAQSLSELLGGKITAESVEGKGSVFYFSIPFNYFNPRPLQPLKRIVYKAMPEKYDWTSKTVLIAEDDTASMQLLYQILKPTGIRIITVTNGNEAVEKMKKYNDIDIILMDIQMPEFNGFQATTKIRSFNPDIPIIAQTAYAMADEKLLCLEAGCTDYISKPIKKSELLLTISKHLGVMEM
jgi:PAS domain S-box-containing protein